MNKEPHPPAASSPKEKGKDAICFADEVCDLEKSAMMIQCATAGTKK